VFDVNSQRNCELSQMGAKSFSFVDMKKTMEMKWKKKRSIRFVMNDDHRIFYQCMILLLVP